MDRKKGVAHIVLLLLIIVLAAVYFFYLPKTKNLTEKIFPTPTPYQFPYKNPAIPKNRSYRIVIVGDSIVNALGLNANTLREDLISYYPDSEFVTYNYGYPSTNVLSLYERLTEKTKNNGAENVAILKQGFELIIIESFGNNPLSQFPLSEGLQKQDDELEKSVLAILSQKPNAALAFLTPIALDPVNYARGSRDLSPQVRKQWVEERIAYINNHKKFAEEKGIPVIDVFKASLKPNGEVDRTYISDDFIHPSKKGLELISKSIADYIFNNKIFPK
ncbi:MAG: SGNH/GDSL hydrolase family protein [Candidatus Woesebacteria bacterium]|nr:SGNH/GDSL hydrolase family protein [Candidatus Woesebacteria bacterium]